jgi:6-phosphofructokinase 1
VVAAVPKTIDNDVGLIDRSFGFHTSIEQAQRVIQSARVEASCTPGGIGIVKLMGRDSGMIAAHSTIANRQVSVPFCVCCR